MENKIKNELGTRFWVFSFVPLSFQLTVGSPCARAVFGLSKVSYLCSIEYAKVTVRLSSW